MYDFCTYFDQGYLPRGLALYRSLKQHCSSSRLWALCMDRPSYDALCQLNLPDLRLISLEEFERGDDALLKAKESRSRIEYYFTCSPSLPLYVLRHNPGVDLVTYLDADLFFFADPLPIFEEIADHSVAIIGHRFPPCLRHRERHGIYNVGWLSFRRDDHAIECLQWWRERCLEWCYDREEEGRFADQKYLDDWPTRFPNVIALSHKGANLAPWNLANYRIRTIDNQVWVDDQPLIFFHFHGLKEIKHWLYRTHLADYKAKLGRAVRRGIYGPYLRTLLEVAALSSPLLQQSSIRGAVRYPNRGVHPEAGTLSSLFVRGTKKACNLIGSLCYRDHLLVIGGRVL